MNLLSITLPHMSEPSVVSHLIIIPEEDPSKHYQTAASLATAANLKLQEDESPNSTITEKFYGGVNLNNPLFESLQSGPTQLQTVFLDPESGVTPPQVQQLKEKYPGIQIIVLGDPTNNRLSEKIGDKLHADDTFSPAIIDAESLIDYVHHERNIRQRPL